MSTKVAPPGIHSEHLIYTVAEVSELLGLPRPKVYILIETGALKAFKVGSDWRVARIAVDGLVSSYNPVLDI